MLKLAVSYSDCGSVENSMRSESGTPKKRSCAVLGIGLVALDIVVNGDGSAPQMFATGGTCGNVLINLSYLGWQSYPVTRISHDWAGTFVERDLAEMHVHTDFLRMEPLADTPIIIHRIRQLKNGEVRHSFRWRCPGCGRHLPSYRPVTLRAVQAVPLETIRPKVFFFDRPSAGALRMAREARALGILVFFEFAGKGLVTLLPEALRVSHIVKYSEERAPEMSDLRREAPPIEIMTQGARGLSFRCHLKRCRQSKWMKVDSYALPEIKDTAGAGDWCAAGLIDRLGTSSLAGLAQLRRNQLLEALRYAQALAAINCCYEGARGSTYALPRKKLKRIALRLLQDGELHLPETLSPQALHRCHKPCPICGTTS